MTDLVFHIGDAKTGTSSIQHALHTRSWDCPTVSLAYPDTLTQIPLAQSLYRDADRAMRDARFRRMSQWLDGAGTDVAVISAEHFENVDPRDLQAALREFMPGHAETARFVAYVRPHADRIVSAFAQRTKTGLYTGDLEGFFDAMLKKGRFFYAPRFNRWRDCFGDRLVLRPFVRDRLYQGDVVQDFLQIVLKEAPFALKPVERRNETVGLRDLAALRELQLLLVERKAPAELRHAIGAEIAGLFAAMPGDHPEKPTLDRSMAQRFVETYGPDAVEMDHQFFDGTPLSDALAAAPGKAVDQPQSIQAQDHFAPGALRDIRIWADLVTEILSIDSGAWVAFLRQQRQAGMAGDTAPAGYQKKADPNKRKADRAEGRTKADPDRRPGLAARGARVRSPGPKTRLQVPVDPGRDPHD